MRRRRTIVKVLDTHKRYAVGYVRVSTEGQKNEGVSLDMQVAKIRAYCAMNDLILIGIYGDPGISGKDINGRPGLQAVLELAERGHIGHVVAYKLNRIARNTIDALEISSSLDKRGIALHSICEKLDTKSAIGRFFFAVLSALAEMERAIISENTRAALQHKKAKGERYGRTAPYGYTFRRNPYGGVFKMVPEPKEQEIIQLVVRMREGTEMSWREIARTLWVNGYRNRHGKPFGAGALIKMYENAEEMLKVARM